MIFLFNILSLRRLSVAVLLTFFYLPLVAQQTPAPVTAGNIRIRILSSTLFELQVRSAGEKRLLAAAPATDYKVSTEKDHLSIETVAAKLCLPVQARDFSEVSLTLKSAEGKTSTDNILAPDRQNLGGVVKSLDKFEGRMNHRTYDMKSKGMPEVPPSGLISRRGWTVLKYDGDQLLHGNDTVRTTTIYLFAFGHDYYAALRDLTTLTGRIPMLPQWALGIWFSRYQPISAQQYREYLAQFRQLKMPLDVVICDMNWHADDWYGLRYNQALFPDMPGFLNWAHGEGLHVGFNHHPGGVSIADERVTDFARDAGLTTQLAKLGTSKGKVLAFDYHNPALFEKYYRQFLTPLIKDGLDFHWVDGYPDLPTVRRYYEMTRHLTQKRTLVLTRQTGGSFQAHIYPLAFSGDTWIGWKTLDYTLENTISGANNGIYWSHDVGGFMKGEPDGELFARWIQSAALAPIMRLHADGGPAWNPDPSLSRLPWTWGPQVLAAAQAAFQLRCRFLPYLYTQIRLAYDSGRPLAKGMYFNYPDYEKAYQYKYAQYLLGDDVLVAPITGPSGRGESAPASKTLWIPPGTWHDYHSGEAITGPVEIDVKKPLDQLPLYIRAGAVITTVPYRLHAMQPVDTLRLEVFQPAGAYQGTSRFYEDDGTSLAYEKQVCRWTRIDYSHDPATVSRLRLDPAEGTFANAITARVIQLVVRQTIRPSQVSHNGHSFTDWTYDPGRKELLIQVPAVPTGQAMELEFR